MVSIELQGDVKKLGARMSEIDAEIKELKGEQARILEGFPDSDPQIHRRYHDADLKWRELRNKLIHETLSRVVTTGALAGAGWLAYAIFLAIKMEVVK